MIANRPLLTSALTYIVVTGWIGRDVLRSLGTTIANDPGDPVLNAAILAWNAVHLPWTEAWFQFPIFDPTPNALALSEHLLGVSVIATPIYWVTSNALTTYNLTLLLTYPLAGATMFLLVRRLTGSAGAAFLSGLAFAFAPYRASQLPHIQMLASFWAPLALLGLHRFADAADRRWRWLALFAICWMLQGAANGYFLIYFTVLIGLWVLWFLAARARLRDAGFVAMAGAIALVPLVPILYRYLTVHHALGLSRNLGEIAGFGADVAAPFCAPPSLAFWGWLRVACVQEGELFAGATLLAICAAGVWLRRAGRARRIVAGPQAGRPGPAKAGLYVRMIRRMATGVALVYLLIAVSVQAIGPWRLDAGWFRASASAADKPLSVALALMMVAFLLSSRFHRIVRRGSTATFYLAAAIVCWVLSWGPFPRLFGADALYQAPFAWLLLLLPGVGGLRVPARFWMMTVMCLVIFMGFAVAALLAGRGRRASFAFVSIAACGLVADGLMTIPAAEMPRGMLPTPARRDGAVLILPLGDQSGDTRAVYDAVNGGWRSINGYSGYQPGYYEALRTLSRAGDPALFQPFRAFGDLHVMVDEGDGTLRTLVERQPGSEAVRLSGGQRQYWLPRRPADEPAPPLGRLLMATGLSASCSPEGLAFATDADMDTRWVCGIQNAEHQVTFDLGYAATTGAIVHALGTAGADFPRQLVVETSLDGQVWDLAWQGSPAAAVLQAAMQAPRSTRAVFSFTPRPARYVRMRQTGRHEVNYWSIAEFEVWTGA